MSITVTMHDSSPALRPETDDDALIAMWMHGRPATTTREYAREVARFLTFTGSTVRETTLGDVQAFADSLIAAELAPATRARILATVKSPLAFAHRLGYVPFDVGRPVKIPSSPDRLNERILSEAAVQRMIALEADPRNAVLLRLLYAGGLRVSELAQLRWRDVQERDEGGQVTLGHASLAITSRYTHARPGESSGKYLAV